MASLKSILFSFVSITSISWVICDVILPPATGPYTVAQNDIKIVDESRIDPLDPKNGTRAVGLSIFYPVAKDDCKKTCQIENIPPKTAKIIDTIIPLFNLTNVTAEGYKREVCCEVSPKGAAAATKFPLVLFSPGYGGSRHYYNTMNQDLASHGYAVAVMEHPYDTDPVVFPDGEVIRRPDPIDIGVVTAGVLTRIADTNFTLNQLAEESVAAKLVPGANCGFDTSKVAFYGHSLGGATAIASLQHDKRLAGGANIDGSNFWVNSTIQQPVLLFGGGYRVDNRTFDPTWPAARPLMKGYNKELDLRGAGHYDFMDIKYMLKLSGRTIPPGPQAWQWGTIDGERAWNATVTYMRAFVDFVLKGKKSELLEGPNKEYPEVVEEKE